MEAKRKQLEWKSWKIADNAARDRSKWRKLLSSPMHLLGGGEMSTYVIHWTDFIFYSLN